MIPNSLHFSSVFIVLLLNVTLILSTQAHNSFRQQSSFEIVHDKAATVWFWKGKDSIDISWHFLANFACVLSVSGSCSVVSIAFLEGWKGRCLPLRVLHLPRRKSLRIGWSETQRLRKCVYTPTISPHRPAGLAAWRPGLGLSENSFFLDGQVWRLAPSSLQMCQLVPIGQTRRSGAKLSTITCTLVAHPSAS